MKLHPLEIDFSRHISLQKKHPWIFRDKFKSYTKTFKNGDIIHIKDIQSNRETYGIYSESGPVSIRIFHFSNTFNLDTLLINSIRKRFPLLKETNSLRWIHGENDGFPGVVIDGHANVLTVMYYSPSLQVYARFLASKVFKILSSSSEVIDKPEIIINLQARRTGEGKTSGTRFWRGNIDKNAEIMIHYDKLNYRIRPFSGKGGIYNDIRNLRRYLSLHIELIKNKHILNLFSNNGLLSIYLEKLGASQVTSLESSNTMLENHR
ncbi:MAG: hypothetical protein KDK45_23810, partial [Leptospiraceae bacterium]|nr:hypothetical protein [Leptospiraceae bacterium]